MARIRDTTNRKFNSLEEMADTYIRYVTRLLRAGKYESAVLKAGEGKIRIETGLRRKDTTIWRLEKIAQAKNAKSNIIDQYYTLCLFRSFWKLEDFILYMERDRPQAKRFYLPRMNPLSIITEDIEDLFNRKIKFLGISLPSRTGKALAYDTPVLTKEGWMKHGELDTSDYVLGGDGKFKRVLAVHPQCDMEYKVIFSDGEEIICHGNHEWVMEDGTLLETREIPVNRAIVDGSVIDRIEKIEGYRGNCITVEDGVYLVGKTLKPTHNSTLSLFALAWLTMKRPNSHSAIGSHSGILAEGFYDEMMNFYTSSEYTFAEIYHFWNGDKEIIQDKSAEHLTINLCEPDRLNTLTMRGIDGTWTGAVDISWDGVLTVDDLVRDRTHALSPTRMEGTWNEYLNKMHDRLNPFLATDGKDPREYDLQGLDIFPEPPEMMIGTLWNIYDPLYRYERKYIDDPLYRFRKIPALNEDNESNFSYVPTSYYLNQKEILSEADFAAKFQQSPFVREGLLFAKGELNYFDGNLPNDSYKIVAVLDPAVGGGDFLSMPIVAVGKKKFIIDWIYDNRTRGITVPRIIRKIINHKVRELYYENNGIGRAFEDPIKEGLKKENYFGIKINTFNAPEHMNKTEKISYYADSVKNELYFIEEGSKGQYKRSQEYSEALWSVNTFTLEGKNVHDDAPDSLAQVMRVFEEKSNGTVDIILNPFR